MICMNKAGNLASSVIVKLFMDEGVYSKSLIKINSGYATKISGPRSSLSSQNLQQPLR